MKVQIKKLYPEVELPAYARPGDAGMDLRAHLPKAMWLQSGECKLIPTGIAVHVADPNYAAFILPRSGLGHKHGIVLGNLVGTIDAPYLGELMVSAWNRSDRAYEIQPGERIAQLLVQRIERVEWEVVEAFVQSERGESGFGHSGRI